MKLPKDFIADTHIADNLKLLSTTYNRLTTKAVIGYAEEGQNKTRRTCYLFECSCGNSCILRGKDVKSGKTKSCGCLHSETSAKQGRKNTKQEKTDNPAFERYYAQYQASAKRRNYSFNIDKQAFRDLTSSCCHYCGVIPQKNYGKGWKGYSLPYICNGLDRMDNTLGYESDNVVPCCSKCNRAKHTMSYQEFNEWLSLITIFRTGIESFKFIAP